MNVLTPLQTGLSGISRGLENLQEIATDIAQAGTQSGDLSAESTGNEVDLTQSLADLQQQKLATQASAKVVASAEEVLGTIIDTVA